MTVCVVGLGYVGTPLAEAFAEHLPTIGFDIDERKIQALIDSDSKVRATSDPEFMRQADIIIICVPTPVTKQKIRILGQFFSDPDSWSQYETWFDCCA